MSDFIHVYITIKMDIISAENCATMYVVETTTKSWKTICPYSLWLWGVCGYGIVFGIFGTNHHRLSSISVCVNWVSLKEQAHDVFNIIIYFNHFSHGTQGFEVWKAVDQKQTPYYKVVG